MTITMNDCTECYAIPGANSLIDVINPQTELTWCLGQTAAEVAEREPQAVRMRIEDWCADKAARQRTPITWEPTTASTYEEMLNVLPPAAWLQGAFLVGEPTDHDAGSGQPRYHAYRCVGQRYESASRPLTRAEFKAELLA